MASARQHQIDFLLNARMNGGFSGTFSKAQAEFARLGKEIQGLQRIQTDISSYQKQEQAVAATTAKLANLQKRHDLLQKEIAETSGSTTALEREDLRLQQQIDNTRAALERQNDRLAQTGARLREAGADTGNLIQKNQELTAKIKELESAQEQAASKATQGIAAVGETLAAAGIAVALKEIADAFGECVVIAADFQAAMSTVEALSGASAQEMAALTAAAKELGATTKFTAKESADAMGYMAMAGWGAADMLQGMDGVLQLAAASGEDLAMVSDIVTDSLTAFGLTAADTAHFSDVLAAAATNSNTNVSIMGETFKQAAPLAGALKYSIEDVATAVGLMANAGVKGSIAGTSLKNIFNGLLEGVTLTGAAFGEYEFSAVRADGTMKSFGSTLEELRGVFAQMTEAEKMSNAESIAGMRGYAGLLSILNATNADYASLTDSINNCTGAAERMAKIKLDNLNGQLTLMNSAWDALKTTIGEEFNPELRTLAEVGTDALTWVNAFVREHPALVKGIMAATGAAGGLAMGITGVTAAMKLASVASSIFAGTMGVALGPVLGVSAAIAGVVGVVTALSVATDDGIPSVKELTEATREMREAMDEAGDTFDRTSSQTLAVAQVAETYIGKLEELGEGTEASTEHSRTYLNTLSLLCNAVPELTEYVDLETGAIEGGTEALRQQTEEWKKNAEAKAYQEYMNDLMGQYNDVMTESAANSIKLTEAEIKLEKLEKARETDLARLNELKSKGTALTAGEQAEYARLEDTLLGYNSEILTATETVKTYSGAVEEDNAALAEAEAVINAAREAYERLTDAEAEQSGILPELQNALEPVLNDIDRLAAAYDEAYKAAEASIAGQYTLWDEAEKIVPKSVDAVNKALESQAKYWQEYDQNIQILISNAGDIAGLNEMLAGLDAGDKNTVNFVAGLAKAAKTDKKALEEMVQNWQEANRREQEAAESFSAYATGLSSEIDGIQETLVQAVQDMELSDEAAESARTTIQAYIDQAKNMKSPLRSAFAELWQGVLDSMPAVVPAVPAPAVAAAEIRTKKKRSEPGFASGTQNAPPGWAWVGEEGPELLYFSGGERVLNARQSAQAAIDYTRAEVVSEVPAMIPAQAANVQTSYTMPVRAEPLPAGNTLQAQFVFNISGNATPETVQDLRAFGDEIVARVLDTMEDERADRARRAIR